MYSPGIPEFKYSSITLSESKKDKYIYLQLSKRIAIKRFSLGRESKESLDKALEAAYAIERYCDSVLASSEAINLDEIVKIVETIKKPHLKVVAKSDIRVLWQKYVDFHLSIGRWTETYLHTHVQTVGNLIARPDFPQSIDRPSEILQWLLNGKRSLATAKDRFGVIVSAVDWASRNDLVERKYGLKYRDCLSSLNGKLKKKDGSDETEPEEKIDPFSKEEVQKILEALRTESHSRFKGKHKQYYYFIKFLWLTGCRPSEAIALKWSNINFKQRKIKFSEGQVTASGKTVKKKGTKTEPYRFFPINNELLELLESIPKSDNHVFLKEDGTPINQHTVLYVWKRLLPKIGIRYRIPYQLRHSMISHHANRGFPLTQLAEIVGNSEKVIREHYLKVDITLINVPTID